MELSRARVRNILTVYRASCPFLSGLIMTLQSQVKGGELAPCRMEVRRGHILQDALKATGRPSFRPDRKVEVHFVGETGIDTGGLTRELWRLLSRSASLSMFHGPGNNRTPIHSVQCLQSHRFRKLGQLAALSVIHEGPGIPFVSNTIFDYITGVELANLTLCPRSIPDACVAALAQEMEESNDFQFQEILKRNGVVDTLVDAGCTSPLSKDRKSVVDTLCLHHCVLSVKAELDQLCEGLGTMGVLDVIRRHPKLFARYFLSEEQQQLSSDFLRDIFQEKKFSDKGTTQREIEEATYMFFLDFLEECESGKCEASLKDVLSFFTGAEGIPPLGLVPAPTLHFNQLEVYPTASTYAMELVLPTKYEHYEDFKEKMITGILFHGGFGKD